MSIPGGNHPPYRQPCDGTATCWLGPQWQNAKGGDDNISAYKLSVQVPNWDTSSGAPSEVTPYEKPAIVDHVAGSCEYGFCASQFGGTSPPCEPWIGSDLNGNDSQYTLVAGQANTAPAQNTIGGYTQDGTIDLAVCKKTGFKNVQARRFWHGRYGFGAPAGCSDTVLECDDGSQIVYESYQSSPVQTKYLSETRKAIGSWTGNTAQGAGAYNPSTGNIYNCSWSSDLQYDYEQTISVDPLSGVTALSDYVYISTHGTYSLTTIDNVTGMSGPSASGNMVILDSSTNYWGAELPSDWSLAGPQIDNGESSTSYIFASELFKWEKFIFGFDACGGLIMAGVGGLGFSPMPVNQAQLQAAIDSYYDAINEQISENPEWSGSGSGIFEYDNLSATGTFSAVGGKNIPDETGGDGTYVISEILTVDVSVIISGPNTTVSVYADALNLLAYWPLTDDRFYPWRTDGLVSVSPLVTRNETSQNVSPDQVLLFGGTVSTVNDLRSPIDDANGNAPFTINWMPTYTQMNWFDPNAFSFYFTPRTDVSNSAAAALVQLYDGMILGAPNPAGYQDNFMFQFLDWRACESSTGAGTPIWDWFQYGYGILLSDYNSFTDAQIPTNATQWTNNYQSINKPPYAWAIYADPRQIFSGGIQSGSADDNSSLWVCKYAEIKESWPSLNAARPGGDDKFALDETQVYSATNVAGAGPNSTWTIKNPMGNTPTTVNTSGYLGGPIVGGFYSGCTYASGTLTLGTLAFNVPSNWESASNDTQSCLGLLRWPTAPALLGRASVTVDTTGMNFTFGVGQSNFGMAVTGAEMIDIYDKNMNLIASAVTATRVNDSTFTTAAAYVNAVWVVIHGAPAWYFNDQYQKGDFLTIQTVMDYRTNGEYERLAGVVDCAGNQVDRPDQNTGYASFSQTQHCLGFQPCNPRVICFSPNGESFPNGITIGFPETFVLDEQYGSCWQGVIQQVMDDPLWQVPHRRIGLDPSNQWLMANVCDTDNDTQSFYAHVPQVEAIMQLPNNYGTAQNETPPDPFSVYESLAWLDSVTNDAGAGVYYPPQYAGFTNGGNPAGVLTSSILHTEFMAAIAQGADCPFNYSDEVIL